MDINGSLFWWIDQWEKREQDYICQLIEYYPENESVPVPYGVGRIKAQFLKIKTNLVVRETAASDNKNYGKPESDKIYSVFSDTCAQSLNDSTNKFKKKAKSS